MPVVNLTNFLSAGALFAGESNGVNVLAEEVPNRGEGEKPHIWNMAGCGY